MGGNLQEIFQHCIKVIEKLLMLVQNDKNQEEGHPQLIAQLPKFDEAIQAFYSRPVTNLSSSVSNGEMEDEPYPKIDDANLAQFVGIVEIYQLEVIFSSSESALPQKTPQEGILCGALLNIVQSVQKMIGEISNTYPEKPCELQASEKGSNQSKASLCDQGNDCVELHNSAHQGKDFTQCQQESDCISHTNQVEHCGGQSGSCLSPQHPTTKETEAANVLMNLSGKAADRIIHGRLETSIHSKVLSEFDNKSTIFLLPTSGSPTSKLDLNIKREHIVCDEVPQINEKDLLPLATQVLCQFCSKQCEDLVELHEHVLALHNVPDSELSLMSSTKRLKNSCEEESLEVEGTLFPLASSKTKKDVLLDGRVMEESEKNQNASPLVSSCISQEKNDQTLLHHCENKSKTSIVSNETVKTFQVIMPPKVGKSYELESFLLEQQQIQTIAVKSEKENQNQQRNGDEVAVNLPKANTSKGTAIANDVLAIAVEPLQIKSIEAKVTIFVCLKCSCSYTHSRDFKNHKCSGDQPFIKTCVDGSVVLVDNPSAEEDHLQPSNYNIWYFPEFLIRQRSKRAKDGSQNLEIVHCGSGRKLQLLTSYQPAYLGDQFISFRCPICEKDYDSLDHFLEHLVTGPCMFRCPECSLVYKNQDKLQSHRTSLHPNIEDRTCPNCQMVFEKRHQRNKHLKTQCSENHTCGVCGRVLKNEYNLQVHMQSHKVEREHVCKECGDAFYRRTILLRHMMRHSGTRPHACTLCSAKFFTRQHLNIHLDRHNNFKRYPCSECSKAYFSKYDRDSHYMKIHNKGSAGHKLPLAKEESVNKPQGK